MPQPDPASRQPLHRAPMSSHVSHSSPSSWRRPVVHDFDDDAAERGGALVWVAIGVAAIFILGVLGYAGFSVLPSRDEPPASAIESPSATTSVPPSPSGQGDGEVTLVLDIAPKDASVSVDGTVVAERKLRYPKSDVVRRLVVSAPGYVTSKSEFTTSVGGTLSVSLMPKRKGK